MSKKCKKPDYGWAVYEKNDGQEQLSSNIFFSRSKGILGLQDLRRCFGYGRFEFVLRQVEIIPITPARRKKA